MKKSILTPLLGDCEYTTYAYDGWGALTNTAYSDGTPTVSVRNDALGGDGPRQLPHAVVRPRDGPLALEGPHWPQRRPEPVCVLRGKSYFAD